jgi:hypothetical protein
MRMQKPIQNRETNMVEKKGIMQEQRTVLQKLRRRSKMLLLVYNLRMYNMR